MRLLSSIPLVAVAGFDIIILAALIGGSSETSANMLLILAVSVIGTIIAVLGSGAGTETKRPPGSLVVGMPESMKVEETRDIEVRVGDSSVELAAIKKSISPQDIVSIGKTELAPCMETKLIYDPKKIHVVELSSRRQPIADGKILCWNYRVTAVRSGNSKLQFLTSLTTSDPIGLIDQPLFEATIKISDTPLRLGRAWLSNNWIKALWPVVVFLAGALSVTDIAEDIVATAAAKLGWTMPSLQGQKSK